MAEKPYSEKSRGNMPSLTEKARKRETRPDPSDQQAAPLDPKGAVAADIAPLDVFRLAARLVELRFYAETAWCERNVENKLGMERVGMLASEIAARLDELSSKCTDAGRVRCLKTLANCISEFWPNYRDAWRKPDRLAGSPMASRSAKLRKRSRQGGPKATTSDQEGEVPLAGVTQVRPPDNQSSCPPVEPEMEWEWDKRLLARSPLNKKVWGDVKQARDEVLKSFAEVECAFFQVSELLASEIHPAFEGGQRDRDDADERGYDIGVFAALEQVAQNVVSDAPDERHDLVMRALVHASS
jgi:hypothetical protein